MLEAEKQDRRICLHMSYAYRLLVKEIHRIECSLTCNPALAERDTDVALALPESLPALPPACTKTAQH